MPSKCHRCQGTKYVTGKVKNLGTLEWVRCTIVCPDCKGEGRLPDGPLPSWTTPHMKDEEFGFDY